jgi:hypothetical protein
MMLNTFMLRRPARAAQHFLYCRIAALSNPGSVTYFMTWELSFWFYPNYYIFGALSISRNEKTKLV